MKILDANVGGETYRVLTEDESGATQWSATTLRPSPEALALLDSVEVVRLEAERVRRMLEWGRWIPTRFSANDLTLVVPGRRNRTLSPSELAALRAEHPLRVAALEILQRTARKKVVAEVEEAWRS